MRVSRAWLALSLAAVLSPLVVVACGGAEAPSAPGADGGGTGGDSTAGGKGGRTNTGIDLGGDGGEDTGTGGDAGGATADVCAGSPCPTDQSCQAKNGKATCVPNDCKTLKCETGEECVTTAGGAQCESLACTGDVQCAPARFCDTASKLCKDDVCTPGVRSCSGAKVVECLASGGGTRDVMSCGANASGQTAACVVQGDSAGCGCVDDWDCGANFRCEGSICIGTGAAPTCQLPPAAFSEVLPAPEIEWIGDDKDGGGNSIHPYPTSRHVASTPAVANLDDDNGDGVIDERDFPEVVFLTYADGNGLTTRGVVRAIHGGGPKKGKDYFAVCGNPQGSGATAYERWTEDSPATPTVCDPSTDAAIVRPAGAPAVGDLDGDGKPEIVVATRFGSVLILDNKGQLLLETTRAQWPTDDWRYPAVALADMDHDGLSEIAVGNRVIVLKLDAAGKLLEERVFAGNQTTGAQYFGGDSEHMGPSVCIANIGGDAAMELVAGTAAYRLPARATDCAGADAATDWCTGKLALVWDGATVNAGGAATDGYATVGAPKGIAAGAENREGYCAVADVLGADRTTAPGPTNALDGSPEVVVIANGALLVFEGASGKLAYRSALGGGTLGGAPNIDDFDGDGFPEIATALSDFYTVVDLQPATASCPAWTTQLTDAQTPPGSNSARAPGSAACTGDGDCNSGAFCKKASGATTGSCQCLHNSWRRDTEDDSSRATSSSVFDFNGDGLAEVVYNDECYLRIYDGANASLLFKRPSLSRTIIENPAVADVDNDGNAEIVIVTNTETVQCSETDLTWPEGGATATMARSAFKPGLRVWGDSSDRWVSARRIWNQHSYHVTNISEAGAIPQNEADSWKNYGGRQFNTYRSQPRSFGVAPDLTVAAVQLTTPTNGCGSLPANTMTIAVQLTNEGDLRVGPGVKVVFEGTFGSAAPVLLTDSSGKTLTQELQANLEPKGSLFFQLSYSAGWTAGTTGLPTKVRVIVDPASAEQPDGGARECQESNNSLEATATTTDVSRAELSVSVGAPSGCPTPGVNATVTNSGSAPASNVHVHLFVGDPQAGGRKLAEKTIAGPIAPGKSAVVAFAATGFPLGAPARLWAVVDPDGAIAECSDANNVGGPSASLTCPRDIR